MNDEQLHALGEMKRLYDEAVDEVISMVSQHCSTERGLESMALSANCDAIRFLVKIGKVKIIKEYGRMIIAEWVQS